MLALCWDGRLWKHDSRGDWLGCRIVRYRDCAGFKMCNEDKRIFYINFEEWNQKYFDKNGNCVHCAGFPQHTDCNARKYTCFISDTEADIYHHGQHKCKAKSTKSSRPASIVNDALAVDLALTISQIQSNCVISALSSRTSWDEVDILIEESASVKRCIVEESANVKQCIVLRSTLISKINFLSSN